MTLDREQLESYLEQLADRYTAGELVEALEEAGLITVWAVMAAFENELIEMKERLEV